MSLGVPRDFSHMVSKAPGEKRDWFMQPAFANRW